jgi:hypothetical protein
VESLADNCPHVWIAVSIHILWGPTEVIKIEKEPPRWCFGERKRQPGTWRLLADKEPSYYEPVWVYKCDGCGEDRRFFPGCEPW